MRAIFFSDIHGITNNLDKIEEQINNNDFDYIVVLGDLYGTNINSNQYIYNLLMKNRDKLILLLGNCDSYNEMFVENMFLNLDNHVLFLSHGNEYNYDKLSKIEGSNIFIYGHKHIPYIRKREDIIYICVGSISSPRNDLGCSYMIYDDSTCTIYGIEGNIIDCLKI